MTLKRSAFNFPSKMINVSKIQVQPGNALNETLKVMNQLELKSIRNPEFINFVKHKFKSSCFACYPKLIWEYVQQNFAYKEDVYDEVITAPYILLKTKKGDCDDFALFIKSCLTVLGIKSDYIIFAEYPGRFTHIAVYCNQKVIDGVNANFNVVPKKYNYYKLV